MIARREAGLGHELLHRCRPFGRSLFDTSVLSSASWDAVVSDQHFLVMIDQAWIRAAEPVIG